MSDTRTEIDFRREVVSRYIPTLLALLTHKGEQYSTNGDPALINFQGGSKLAKTSPSHYLMVQATKQWYVISNWSKDGSIITMYKREIVQRLFDVCVYMFLLLFMIEEDGEVGLPGGSQ